MTQLEVIQKFVGALNRNDYAPSGDEVDTDSIESFDGNYLEKNSVTVSGGDRTTFTITRNIMDLGFSSKDLGSILNFSF